MVEAVGLLLVGLLIFFYGEERYGFKRPFVAMLYQLISIGFVGLALLILLRMS